MKTTEPKNRIEELKARHSAELAELNAKERICALLPESLSLPSIANLKATGPVNGWLSFSPDYGTDAKAFAISVFSELEKAGFEPLPLSLCKWGNYRRSVSPGLVADIPNEKRGCFGSTDELNDVEPIAPLYVVPCQFTGVEAVAYYRKGEETFRVCVKAPLRAHLSCRRVEYRGGWRFDGACTVEFPKAWHEIHGQDDDAQCVAHISARTAGYRDTDQGITGVIYWQPLTEQSEFPLTPSQFLAQLFALQS